MEPTRFEFYEHYYLLPVLYVLTGSNYSVEVLACFAAVAQPKGKSGF